MKKLYKRSGNLKFGSSYVQNIVISEKNAGKSHFNIIGKGRTHMIENKHCEE